MNEENWNTGMMASPIFQLSQESILDELVKSHIPYVVHASTSSARTEYQ